MTPTKGPWKLIWNGGVGPNERSMICKPDGANADEARANARLIAEAGTVYHETGLTPRQLAEQRGELVAALEGCLAQCVDRHDAEGSTQAQFMQIELARTALSRARTPATDREDS